LATSKRLRHNCLLVIVGLGLLAVTTAPAQDADTLQRVPSRTGDAGEGQSAGSGDARFIALGAGIGTPAGFTFIGGLYFAPVALRISGGVWGQRWNGFQGDLSLIFNHTSAFAQGVSLVAGVFRTNPVLPDAAGNLSEQTKSVHYVGGTFDMYLAGFFLQIGLAHGRGDYPNPQLLMQTGYLFAL
jgi:hypothetical protein